MGSLNLPIDNDARFADSSTDASQKEHQQQHDKANRLLNEFDADAIFAASADGLVLALDASTGLFRPITLTVDGSGNPSPSTTLANAPAGSLFRVVYSGGWPASRPTTRTDIFFDLVGVPLGTALPTWMLAGDTSTTRDRQTLAAADSDLGSRVSALEARPVGSGSGTSVHGQLSGLSADDHPQYLTTGRADTLFPRSAAVTQQIADAVSATSTEDRKRGNHTGTQGITSIDGLQGLLDGKVVPLIASAAGVLAVTVGAMKIRVPAGATVAYVTASVATAPAGAAVIVDVNRNGVSIFGSNPKPTIAAGATDATVAGTTASNGAYSAGDTVSVDIDQVGSSTAGADLTVVVWLKF